MIRTAGLLLLSASIATAGFIVGESAKKQCRDIEYLLALTLHLKREICLGKTKLSTCFALFPEEKNGEVTQLLSDRLFDKAIERLHLSKAVKKRVTSFFQYLGSGGTEEETFRCEQIIAFLSEEREREKNNLQDKVKVARTAGVCIAGVVLLLFL